MPKFKILPEKTALLVIDMTNAFLKPGASIMVPDGLSLIPRLRKLLEISRRKGLRVIYTTHVYRRDGSDLGLHAAFHHIMRKKNVLREGTEDVQFYAEIRPEESDIVLEKPRFDAFLGTELDLILRSQGIDTLLIGGVVTNICCESTARDARMRDYKVIFLSDGTAAMDIPDMGWGKISAAEVQRYTLSVMASHFAQVLSVEQVIKKISEAQ